MSSNTLARRSFLKQASIFAIAVLTFELGLFGSFGCNQAASRSSLAPPTGNVSWKTSIVAANEPGEPMVVTGTIFAPDGRSPLEGINLMVYQTDATGRYSTSGFGGDNRDTRIHGHMRTGQDGRYEFRTIRPGSYPGSRNPQHIHAYISGPGYPEYWIDEYNFDDDPFVTDDMRRKFAGKGSRSPIVTLKRDSDGIWKGVRDIVVERCSGNCTGR
jgi:protocatechuate 3,4-dioxygenase beta subunit